MVFSHFALLTAATIVTVWSLKTIRRTKLLRHHKISLCQTKQKTTFIRMVVHVHEENDFVTSLLPLEELTD
jgi:hypothetical protein